MTSNRENLRALMTEHGLTRREVCALTHKGKSAVDAWLTEPGKGWSRPMPDAALELLKLKLSKRKKGAKA